VVGGVTLKEVENMLQRMEAEILFLDPDDVNLGSATLIEQGFEVEVLDWIDDSSPTVWINATITTELDQYDFFLWVYNIAWRLGGDVVEAGLQNAK
jgi:hypothetical protein